MYSSAKYLFFCINRHLVWLLIPMVNDRSNLSSFLLTLPRMLEYSLLYYDSGISQRFGSLYTEVEVPFLWLSPLWDFSLHFPVAIVALRLPLPSECSNHGDNSFTLSCSIHTRCGLGPGLSLKAIV